MILFILFQATTLASPDIVIDARAQIREVRIEQKGEASLVVRGVPGSEVRVQRPETNGRSRLRNVNVAVRAEARIGDPDENRPVGETAQPD